MSNNYDNWERLVRVVLRREDDRQLALAVSRESSFNSISSSSFRSELDYDQNPQLEANIVYLLPHRTAPQVSSLLGKAGILGLEKAGEVLDIIGSSMTNLKFSGFIPRVSSQRNKISILAFEVASTIAKGANLVQSLSVENIQFLRNEVFHSGGLQKLVSTDVNELLRIAAADKREEFDVFSREVTRFGNLSLNAQFHNLDRFFSKLDSDPALHKQSRKAKMTIRELTSLAQHTFELYHELHALDKFDQDYRQTVEELDSLHLSRKGEGLVMLRQRKLVQIMKKKYKLVQTLKIKSLWSKRFEEVVAKLVDVATSIHHDILESFGDNGLTSSGEASTNKPEKLGVAALSLHYANIITQIDYIVSHLTSFDREMRDTLYNGLPPNVKDALRSRLQIIDTEEKLTAPQIKIEMGRTLQWLVPLATNTTKAHQGFGSVREWGNAGNEFGNRIGMPKRWQTLYHADKQKVDSYILELVAWLHRLVTLVIYNDYVEIHELHLPSDDENFLDKVVKRKIQNRYKVWALRWSTVNSPPGGLEHLKGNILDMLDGLDSTFLAPREDIR